MTEQRCHVCGRQAEKFIVFGATRVTDGKCFGDLSDMPSPVRRMFVSLRSGIRFHGDTPYRYSGHILVCYDCEAAADLRVFRRDIGPELFDELLAVAREAVARA